MDFYKYSKIILTLILGIALLAGSWVVPDVVEANATFSYSPGSKNVAVGETFSLNILLSTSGKASGIYVVSTFPSSILSAQTIKCAPGYMEVAPQIANGSASVSCASIPPNPPFSGSGKHVATITLKAKASGSGALKFGASKVDRNEPPFDNMYTGGGSAKVSVSAPSSGGGGGGGGGGGSSAPEPTPPPQQHFSPTPVPVTGVPGSSITSSSHPNQDSWYKSREVEFSWSGGGDGYNFGLDKAAGTQLPTSVRDTKTSYKQAVDGDGVWYFHVRKKSGDDWSATTHYRVQIDGSAPANTSIEVEPDSPMTVLPMIKMSAEDGGSGIDRYEVKIGDGEWHKIGDGYKPKTLTSGTHMVVGRAYDKAGNFAEVQKEISIVPLASPEISWPKGGLLMLGERFGISGRAVPSTKVELYINDELKETVTSDEDGNFSSSEEYLLFPGTYTVTAKAINDDGITSPLSEPVQVTIDAQAVSVMGMVLPGWGVYGGVGVTVSAILAGLLWGLYRLWRQTRLWMGRVQLINKKVDAELAEMHEQLAKSIEENAASMRPETVEALKKQLAESVKEVEEDLGASLGNDAASDVGQVTWDKAGGVVSKAKAFVGGAVVGGVVWVASVAASVKRRVLSVKGDSVKQNRDVGLSTESAATVGDPVGQNQEAGGSDLGPEAGNLKSSDDGESSSSFEKIPGVDDILGG